MSIVTIFILVGDDLMKKGIKVLSIVLISILLFCVCVYLIFIYINRFPEGKVILSKNEVDNDVNNSIAGGNLLKIGDKLYYNYSENYIDYGLTEISSLGSKRVYWKGYLIDPGANPLNPLFRFNDKVSTISYFNKNVLSFDPNKNVMVNVPYLSNIQDLSSNLQIYKNDLYYIKNNNTGNTRGTSYGSQLEVYHNGKSKIILNCSVDAFYIAYGIIYYIDDNGSLRSYNINSQNDQLVFALKSSEILKLIVNSGYAVFEQGGSIYKLNLNNVIQGEQLICTEKSPNDYSYGINSFNIYNGNVYVCSYNGLKEYSFTSNNVISLYDKYTEQCYIVDKDWVYFVVKNSALWRISNDKKTIEKIFG